MTGKMTLAKRHAEKGKIRHGGGGGGGGGGYQFAVHFDRKEK